MLHSKLVMTSVLVLFAALVNAHVLWPNLNSRWMCPSLLCWWKHRSPPETASFSFPAAECRLLNFTSEQLDGGMLPFFYLSIPLSLILPAWMTLTVNYGIPCQPTVCSHSAWYCSNQNNTPGWITWSEGGCLWGAGGGGGRRGGVERCFLKAPLP